MNWQRLTVVLAVLLTANPAFALRCAGKLINDGAPQIKVLKYCGDPDSVQVHSIYRGGLPRHQVRRRRGFEADSRELLHADRAYVEIRVEEWTYNFGPRRLMRVIRFENGIVTSIRQLGYGYR
ncbi:MAG: DUF2845 domain-containing protein [Gammaproteobacteria bacterium]